jgi:hypothetical protein
MYAEEPTGVLFSIITQYLHKNGTWGGHNSEFNCLSPGTREIISDASLKRKRTLGCAIEWSMYVREINEISIYAAKE